jgi:hypothetical protein
VFYMCQLVVFHYRLEHKGLCLRIVHCPTSHLLNLLSSCRHTSGVSSCGLGYCPPVLGGRAKRRGGVILISVIYNLNHHLFHLTSNSNHTHHKTTTPQHYNHYKPIYHLHQTLDNLPTINSHIAHAYGIDCNHYTVLDISIIINHFWL